MIQILHQICCRFFLHTHIWTLVKRDLTQIYTNKNHICYRFSLHIVWTFFMKIIFVDKQVDCIKNVISNVYRLGLRFYITDAAASLFTPTKFLHPFVVQVVKILRYILFALTKLTQLRESWQLQTNKNQRHCRFSLHIFCCSSTILNEIQRSWSYGVILRVTFI